MAALLVGLAVMTLVMSAAAPMWQTAARREREAELIFRGEQYARAIQLFQRKYANALPPSLDVLVNERFLRRKYLDPITNGEFQLLDAAQAAAITASADGRGGGTGGRGRGGAVTSNEPAGRTGGAAGPGGGASRIAGQPTGRGSGSVTPQQRPGQAGGGIVGVTSRSTEKSLREYRGRGAYNEWAFVPVQRQFTAGASGGTQTPGVGRAGGSPTPTAPAALGSRPVLPPSQR